MTLFFTGFMKIFLSKKFRKFLR